MTLIERNYSAFIDKKKVLTSYSKVLFYSTKLTVPNEYIDSEIFIHKLTEISFFII